MVEKYMKENEKEMEVKEKIKRGERKRVERDFMEVYRIKEEKENNDWGVIEEMEENKDFMVNVRN